MSFDTFANLQTSIGAWLMRSDLSAVIPDFITLAEAKLKQVLTLPEARTQYTATAATWTMPAQIDVLKSLRLVSGSPRLDFPLENVTPEALADFRAGISDVAGRPARFTIVGRDVLFAPTPDQAYTIEATYTPAIVPLSASNTSNSVLAESPGLYLYGALLEAAPYLGEDERVATWQARFDEAVENYTQQREAEKYSASLRPARLPRTF